MRRLAVLGLLLAAGWTAEARELDRRLVYSSGVAGEFEPCG
jgi:hypothetical protein